MGESLTECGEREAMEETGYKIKAFPDSEIVKTYLFRWDGKDYLSTTHFFMGELEDEWEEPGEVDDQDYNKGPRWVPISDLSKYFGYTPEILEAIQALL